jgi:hypothetical protein
VSSQIDRALLEKAADVAAMALRGTMGTEGSQPPSYAGELIKAVWAALKDAAADLPEKPKPGF